MWRERRRVCGRWVVRGAPRRMVSIRIGRAAATLRARALTKVYITI